jgi:hypothetical protein
VTFDEGRLAGPSIADEDQLEGGHVLLGFGHLASKFIFRIVYPPSKLSEL